MSAKIIPWPGNRLGQNAAVKPLNAPLPDLTKLVTDFLRLDSSAQDFVLRGITGLVNAGRTKHE